MLPSATGVAGLLEDSSFLLKRVSAVGVSGLLSAAADPFFLASSPFPIFPKAEVVVGVAGCLEAGGSRDEGPSQPRFGYEVWMVSPPTDLLC